MSLRHAERGVLSAKMVYILLLLSFLCCCPFVLSAASHSAVRRHPQLVVVDAGHGGRDHGTATKTLPCTKEKELALTTARHLKRYLEGVGFRVFMTRDRDEFVPLSDRARMANERSAACFVSIHYNAAANIAAHGVEIFYYLLPRGAHGDSRSEQSKVLAQKVLTPIVHTVPLASRGVKQGNLAVLRETNMPAILIEGGFMTNANEAALICQEGFQQRLAWAIAQGVKTALEPHPSLLPSFAPRAKRVQKAVPVAPRQRRSTVPSAPVSVPSS